MKRPLTSPVFFAKSKLRLKKMLFLMGTWIFAGLFYSVNQIALQRREFTGNGGSIILSTIIATTLAGLLTGLFEAFVSDRYRHKYPVGRIIAANSIFYLALYFGLYIIGMFFYRASLNLEGMDLAGFFAEMEDYFLSLNFLLSLITFGLFVLFSLFLLNAREKFGFGALGNFLTGSYFYPREETRIFMFLDIKSATSIAERLGALKYHRFLNDFFREITYPVLYKEGEIYQYVGDEVSVSWTREKGLKNQNCIECFFEIQKNIENAAGYFYRTYGVIPGFKAGLHIGKIVTGEMGIIKREIVHSGDTLNTASRIQELCNHFNAKLLISKELLSLLNFTGKYSIVKIGECLLRGKTTSTELYGIKNSGVN